MALDFLSRHVTQASCDDSQSLNMVGPGFFQHAWPCEAAVRNPETSTVLDFGSMHDHEGSPPEVRNPETYQMLPKHGWPPLAVVLAHTFVLGHGYYRMCFDMVCNVLGCSYVLAQGYVLAHGYVLARSYLAR